MTDLDDDDFWGDNISFDTLCHPLDDFEQWILNRLRKTNPSANFDDMYVWMDENYFPGLEDVYWLDDPDGEIVSAPRESEIDNRCVLYRVLDYQGNVLYIGQTMTLDKRMKWHERHSRWWVEAGSITFERRFRTREELIEAERQAIQTENPRYNIRLVRN